MSAPSTPRSTRTASPPGGSPEILTPGQKIKAMMAQFESDSESDNEKNKPTTARRLSPKTNTGDNQNTSTNKTRRASNAESEGADEEDDVVMPRGRMAAQMQASTEEGDGKEEEDKSETAFDRVSKTLRAQKGNKNDDAQNESDDDLPMAGPRRRPAQGKEKSDAEEERSDRSLSPARSFSPLFMSSPTAERNADRDETGSDGSDEDEEPQSKNNARLQALIAQKRKEREERERVEAEKKAARAARAAQHEQFSSEVMSGDEDGDEDAGSGNKLTQQSRPSRKASKKALEEMNRETQRMSRNMQLTHQAQTKKKITKESFFAKFNFGQAQPQNAPGSSSSQNSADSRNSSDVEAQKDRDTPRTSPVAGPIDKPASYESPNEKGNEDEADIELPPIEEVLAGTHLQNLEPAAKREEEAEMEQSRQKTLDPKTERKQLKKPPVRVRLSRQSVAQHQEEDSDSDLEVVTSVGEGRRIAAFENLPSKKMEEPVSMTRLKALAHITSPSRDHGSMDHAQLNALLLTKARQQAAEEKKVRIEELRAKGITVETAEDRAAMEDEIENLVEKARQEADDIAKKERKEKKQGQDDDEEDDADFELSGSEDEEADGENEEEDEESEKEDEQHVEAENVGEGMIENEAGEDEESGDEQLEVMSADEADVPSTRRKRLTRVVSDDEDDEEAPVPATPVNPITPNKGSAERLEFPGMPGSNDMPLGLTQAFAGTLGGSQQGSMPNSPGMVPTLPDPTNMAGNAQFNSQEVVKDSQSEPAQTTDIFAGYAASDAGAPESPAVREMSEFSQIPAPTQDAGFILSPFDPSRRFLDPPPSTVETVLVGQTQDSPVKQRQGKHLRRGRVEEKPDIEKQKEGDFEVDASAFDVMKKSFKKKASVPFDKRKSNAKDVVEEAAEESDDEYAGIGGGSDDSDGEEDRYDEQMINDSSEETVDEKQLAALNAMHNRTADEEQVAKLLQDITTGALRRRRGVDDDFDLDDPADELLSRRREKQRENARMRRALLADEKVTEIAEDPKKAAFFKAIEDRDDEDDVDLDFLEYGEEDGVQEKQSSQDAAAEGPNDPAAPESNDNKRKRPLEPSAEDIANRPPPHLRRKPASEMSKKPQNLAEIRETVSFLTERPEYDSFHEDAAIEPEEDHPEAMETDETEPLEQLPDESKEDFARPNYQHPRRTRRNDVVDRLALLRQASSNSAKSSAANGRFAFHSGVGKDPAANIGFRPPLLLRKATTGSSSSSSVSSSSDARQSAPRAPPTGTSGAKKRAVNYYTAAREKEREQAIRAKERSSGSNIKALLEKHGSNRLGMLGNGQWE